MKPETSPNKFPGIGLGVFICIALFLGAALPARAQNTRFISAAGYEFDNIVELFSEYSFAMNDTYSLEQRENVAEQVLELSEEYGFKPGLLIAMSRYEDEYIPAATRLYKFHIDTGLRYTDNQLPRVWDDLNRVCTTFTWLDQTYDDLKDMIAYYIVGQKYFPPEGYDGLNDSLKSTIDGILADADEYQERVERQPKTTEVIIVDDTPKDENFGVGWDYNSMTSQEVRDAYISVMRYYNPRLDQGTANEIFDAILHNVQDYPAIDARFVMALVACESAFRPDSVSSAGAMGLGQLMPYTAESHNVDDPFDASENIRATFEYLQNEFNRWSGKDNIYDYVLASYNAGAGNVKKYDGIPPFEETVNYVYKVTRVYKNFLTESEYQDYIYGRSEHYPDSPV